MEGECSTDAIAAGFASGPQAEVDALLATLSTQGAAAAVTPMLVQQFLAPALPPPPKLTPGHAVKLKAGLCVTQRRLAYRALPQALRGLDGSGALSAFARADGDAPDLAAAAATFPTAAALAKAAVQCAARDLKAAATAVHHCSGGLSQNETRLLVGSADAVAGAQRLLGPYVDIATAAVRSVGSVAETASVLVRLTDGQVAAVAKDARFPAPCRAACVACLAAAATHDGHAAHPLGVLLLDRCLDVATAALVGLGPVLAAFAAKAAVPSSLTALHELLLGAAAEHEAPTDLAANVALFLRRVAAVVARLPHSHAVVATGDAVTALTQLVTVAARTTEAGLVTALGDDAAQGVLRSAFVAPAGEAVGAVAALRHATPPVLAAQALVQLCGLQCVGATTAVAATPTADTIAHSLTAAIAAAVRLPAEPAVILGQLEPALLALDGTLRLATSSATATACTSLVKTALGGTVDAAAAAQLATPAASTTDHYVRRHGHGGDVDAALPPPEIRRPLVAFVARRFGAEAPTARCLTAASRFAPPRASGKGRSGRATFEAVAEGSASDEGSDSPPDHRGPRPAADPGALQTRWWGREVLDVVDAVVPTRDGCGLADTAAGELFTALLAAAVSVARSIRRGVTAATESAAPVEMAMSLLSQLVAPCLKVPHLCAWRWAVGGSDAVTCGVHPSLGDLLAVVADLVAAVASLKGTPARARRHFASVALHTCSQTDNALGVLGPLCTRNPSAKAASISVVALVAFTARLRGAAAVLGTASARTPEALVAAADFAAAPLAAAFAAAAAERAVRDEDSDDDEGEGPAPSEAVDVQALVAAALALRLSLSEADAAIIRDGASGGGAAGTGALPGSYDEAVERMAGVLALLGRHATSFATAPVAAPPRPATPAGALGLVTAVLHPMLPRPPWAAVAPPQLLDPALVFSLGAVGGTPATLVVPPSGAAAATATSGVTALSSPLEVEVAVTTADDGALAFRVALTNTSALALTHVVVEAMLGSRGATAALTPRPLASAAAPPSIAADGALLVPAAPGTWALAGAGLGPGDIAVGYALLAPTACSPDERQRQVLGATVAARVHCEAEGRSLSIDPVRELRLPLAAACRPLRHIPDMDAHRVAADLEAAGAPTRVVAADEALATCADGALLLLPAAVPFEEALTVVRWGAISGALLNVAGVWLLMEPSAAAAHAPSWLLRSPSAAVLAAVVAHPEFPSLAMYASQRLHL